jgi:UDPglucose 6-dehydrogenase
MRVAVIGTGYVGLVSAACLARIGHHVIAIDVDPRKIEALHRGEVPIHEPGLPELVRAHLDDGRLSFTVDMPTACRDAEVIFIAVGTPAAGPGFADLGYVMSAAREIGAHLQCTATLVVKSTVPPGTCLRVLDAVRSSIAARGVAVEVEIASNPEFLREGSAVQDFLEPDRIVVGAASAHAAAVMEQLYAPLTRDGHRLLHMDLSSAELSKYAANAMLAIRISAVNELAAIAEACRADFARVREVLATDQRIGRHFLAAGVGYGGSCFPKDMRALARLAQDAGVDTPITDAAEAVNRRARQRLYEKLETWAAGRGGLSACTIAVWGLAFKPNTDDVREAPSLALLRALRQAGATVRAHDPVALGAARRAIDDASIHWVDTPEAALEGADTLVVLTEWAEYCTFDPAVVARCLNGHVIFDGRNALDTQAYGACGLAVVGVGRGSLDAVPRPEAAVIAGASAPRAMAAADR